MSINIPGFGSTTGGGNISGPASSTSGNFASFNGTTGQTLQDSGKSSSSFANASHTHAQSDITNLTTDLAGKAASSHTHAASDIASGTIATARLGSGTANSTTYLRGDQTWATVTASETVQNSICNGRLTLTSGTPVLTSTVTAATTLYFTPYNGSKIALYTGSAWEYLDFSEVSLSLSGYAANTNFDIWGYNNSGTLVLESTAWANDTTRATNLQIVNGVWLKNGALTRRYLGTIRTTGSNGQTEFSFGSSASGGGAAKLFVWNAQNRVRVSATVNDSTSTWTYTTASWRSTNNSTGNRVSFVSGLQVETFTADNSQFGASSPSTQFASIGLGLNSTSSLSGLPSYINATIGGHGRATLSTHGVVGLNYVQGLEYAGGATMTFYGSGSAAYLVNGINFNFFM